MVPNLIATMAQSTSVARAYLELADALSDGVLGARLREQIALTVSQGNRCDYCVAGHSAVGSSVGLTDDEVRDARNGTSPDRKIEAVLQFARRVVERRGSVSDDDISGIRNAGYGEPEIVEIIAHVGLNICSNYFNLVAQTEIDFPPVADIDP
jgi:AhpD family alkylhydroperoxidase